MTLSDGDPADDSDVWFRIVTQENHIRRGRVHHGALKGNAIAPPEPGKNRPWQREMSGRLRSRAGTIDQIIQHADAYCDEQTKRGGGTKTFQGVMFSRVEAVKLVYKNTIPLGVHFTPLRTDRAHADLTFTGWRLDTETEREEFLIWLSGKLQALHRPGQLQLLLEARVPPEPVLSRLRKFAASFMAGVRRSRC
jgi:hypothetical protein